MGNTESGESRSDSARAGSLEKALRGGGNITGTLVLHSGAFSKTLGGKGEFLRRYQKKGG